MGHLFNWEIANVAMPLRTSFTSSLSICLWTTEASTACSCTCGAAPHRAVTRHQYAKGHPPLPNKQYMLTLVADQAVRPERSYWLIFCQPTPFVRHRNERPYCHIPRCLRGL